MVRPMSLAPQNIQSAAGEPTPKGVVVNDIHSRLNRTVVDRVVTVQSPADARKAMIKDVENAQKWISDFGR